LLEEVGHYIDSKLNTIDSPGDEGQLFAAIVQGEALDTKSLSALKTEDDSGTITVNNQRLQIEESSTDPTAIVGPDLFVSTASVQASVLANETTSVSWTIQNQGDANASIEAGIYFDAIYFSNDPYFDSSDIFLSRRSSSSSLSLAPGTSYTTNQSITIPNSTSENRYLLFIADSNNTQAETNENNNIYAAPIVIKEGTSLINGLGGSAGFGENILARNDDSSTGFINVTSVFESGLNFFGKTYTGFYINNNGNITFDNPISTYTPFSLVGNTGIPIIAPFFTDIDTRAGNVTPSSGGNSKGTNLVYWDLDPIDNTVTVTWDDVGQYSYGTTPNAFQLRFRDLGSGNFFFEFRYEDIRWNYGNARAGYSAANGTNFFELPQSGTSASLDLDITSNSGQPGLFQFSVLNGAPNQPPINIILNQNTVNENSPTGTVIGTLVTTDPDINDFHTYTLINNAGGRFTVSNGNQLVVDNSALLDYELNSTYNIVVRARDAGGLTYDKSFTITINNVPEPDLKIINTTMPDRANVGETVPISWTVINQGDKDLSNSSTEDAIYLSSDAIFDNSDIYLGQEQSPFSLTLNNTYSRTKDITIPYGTSGDRYLLFVTDPYSHVAESDESNNVKVVPFKVTAFDLFVSAANAPESASLGETIGVDWTVTNQGNGRAFPGWNDNVYLSTDSTLDAADILLNSQFVTSQILLEEGSSYTIRPNLTVPNVALGDYYLLFASDVNNRQPETSESNNLFARLITLKAPNLSVSSVSLADLALRQPGQTTIVNWTVSNIGTSEAKGSWIDRVYLSADGNINSAVLLASVARNTPLATGEVYTASTQVTLPVVPDGNYRIIVVTDANNNLLEETGENNNQQISTDTLTIGHPDLAVAITSSAIEATSGTIIPLIWRVTNQGTAETLVNWIDRIYLSTNTTFDASDLLLGQFNSSNLLAAGASYDATANLNLPLNISGDRYLLVVTDSGNTVNELGNETNNTTAAAIAITLAPYADLTPTSVTIPALVIGDPATVLVGWTVTNQGTGVGITTAWSDRIIASKDSIVGNGDDLILGNFQHTGALGVGESYSRSEAILLPARFEGQYNLFVQTDAAGQVFENSLESNNNTLANNPLKVALRPYADLVVSSVAPGANASSGQSLTVFWSVTNQGIGTTDSSSWGDRLWLASDPAGQNRVAQLGSFEHIGTLALSGSYSRSAEVILPNGISGTYYLAVETGGPYEFLYRDNNTTVSSALQVALTPPPDLVVSDIVAPTAIQSGSKIDVSWTITNQGIGNAATQWMDQIFLQAAGNPNAPKIALGSFTYGNGLEAGRFYRRSEQFTVPSNLQGLYQVVVTTNASQSLFENGATGNNTTIDDQTLLVSFPPRADLQVQSVEAPSTVSAGGTVSAKFTVINQGTVGTATPNWQDNIYLSLDNVISSDDVLLGSLTNGSALVPGQSYQSQTDAFVVPRRFRGSVFLLVNADAGNQVDESPQESNNVLAVPLNVTPLPPADLVASDVVAPNQAFDGSRIEVRYKVTNKGIGESDRDSWTDTIWLARNQDRPSAKARDSAPGEIEDYLLATVTHNGSLKVGESYEQVVTLTLPSKVTGEWFITPWSDAYDIVTEDTLSININSDDPNELDNNNYKARPITVLLTPPPDLVVSSVVAPTQAKGGDTFQVNWTVTNAGNSETSEQAWVDTVYLSDKPTLNTPNAKTWILGKVARNSGLGEGQSYTQGLTVTLSPEVSAQYVIVVTDAEQQAWEGPYETNNESNRQTAVTPIPADLVVRSITTQPSNFSGERTTVEWTVENTGGPLWSGTRYWTDEVWISPDPTFIPERATLLGKFAYAPAQPLGTGASYTQRQDVVLPRGIDGNYYLYVSTNVPQKGLGTLDNQESLKVYAFTAYENQSNDRSQASIPVQYREPDLRVTNLVVPLTAPNSGQTIPVSWTVTNTGTRATRENRWQDRVYLSRDASLDISDLVLLEVERKGALDIGASYSQTATLRLPDGIEGNFYLLAFADANIVSVSDIRVDDAPEGAKIYFERGLDRSSARVPEFKDEGNNITGAALPIALTPPPDLQVTSIIAPVRTTIGQFFDVSYTVTNSGPGGTPDRQGQWTDFIYLSRDAFLDLQSDRYLGSFERSGGLAAGASYTVNKSFQAPVDLSGPYYVFAITDPTDRNNPTGKVFEGAKEVNNAKPSDRPLLFEVPPPSDLQVDTIALPSSGKSGDRVQISWTGSNHGINSATGQWSDAVYLSADAIWDITDVLVGRSQFNRVLAPGESYTGTLDATLPAALPGPYRLIVRPDIYNQIYEAENEGNNATASADTINLTVEALQLGVPLQTTLTTGQSRLYQITVAQGQTLKVTLDSAADNAANEVFVRYGQVPSGTAYDATYSGILAPDQTAIVPTTQSGVYYVLIKGQSEPGVTPTTILVDVLPFSITDVVTDRGGDSRYVTVNVEGAQFQPQSILKLVRPGIGEVEPVRYQTVDSTHIQAIFDFTNVLHGLYDVKVINPDGRTAIVPYRYLVERTIEPDVTVGLGGPRVLAPGDTGTYGISIQSLTNIDTPYVNFEFGVPELGTNHYLLGLLGRAAAELGVTELPYVTFATNLRGAPEGSLNNLPWASLKSEVNTNGQNLAPGYIFDLATRDFVGATFNTEIYKRFAELVAKDPDALKGFDIDDGAIAFKFNVTAAATVLTRSEFITLQTEEALKLRDRILADANATQGLKVLASNAETWTTAYLAALESAGLLRPENQAPPLRQDPLVVSLTATLATGILAGPVGQQIRTDGNLVDFFEQVRQWYGNNSTLIAPNGQQTPNAAAYDLGLSHPTHFETFNVYVPYGEARVDLPASVPIPKPNFSGFLNAAGSTTDLSSISGPVGFGTQGLVPLGQALPYSIQFENAASASTAVGEVRIVSQLDSDLDPRQFRLGDIQLGDIQVHLPTGRGSFQGDFDFTRQKGFILRVSAGLDPLSNTETWLLQAIDPKTGEVIQDTRRGLLLPNDVKGNGSGFVTYTAQAKADVATGTEITSQAKILYNTAAPLDTLTLTNVVDGKAPTTELTVKPLQAGSNTYQVNWTATDDENGSGVKHVTVYVAEDGGDFKIWQRQTTETSGFYTGRAGHTYEFLALATDNAGNQEQPNLNQAVPDDGSRVNLGALPSFDRTTAPDLGPAPAPTQLSTNRLFIEAQQATPNAPVTSKPSEFKQVLRPFTAQAFATGIPQSHANIGPMAILPLADGSAIISGGDNRGSLYRVGVEGGAVGTPFAKLPYPVFDLKQATDGTLWAATGGGPLLHLDARTGAILGQYGDGITQAVAISPSTRLLYLSSGDGIEIFNPATERFAHYSDLRVGNLAFAPDGSLWAATWPERTDVVRFDEDNKPQRMLSFATPIDSIAFGKAGTTLEGLLFVSHNSGAKPADGSELTMVDLATLRKVSVAKGGSRGDIVETTADGSVLLSQSLQVDKLNPVLMPRIVSVNPAPGTTLALPLGTISVRFDQDMDSASVLNPANYALIGSSQGAIAIQSIQYIPNTRTAIVAFDSLNPDRYTLNVSQALKSKAGLTLKEGYTEQFTAISDFLAQVDLQFSNPRSDRATQTISYDVTIRNTADYDLLLPVALVLNPADGFTGTPTGAIQTAQGSYLLDLSSSLPDGRLAAGASITGRTITINDPDRLRIEFTPGVYALPYPNQAPVVTSAPVTGAIADRPYTYQVRANDPDGAVLSYLLYKGPEGMTVNPSTGLLSWQPTANSPSTTEVILRVYDTRGGYTTQSFTLQVAGGNRPPVLTPLPTTVKGREGQALQIAIAANDPDNNRLTYWADRLPPGAVFDPQTRTLSWTPGFEAAGTYENVQFTVSDGVNTVTQTTTILIAPVNQAPALIKPSDRTVREGETVRFQLQGQDPEGATLTYFSKLLPGGAVLDPKTGLFEWTPTFFQAGTFEIPFIASDGSTTATQTVKLTVLNVNAAPEFEGLTPWQVAEGQQVRFRAFAFDADNPGFIPQDRNSSGQLTIQEGSNPTVNYTVSGLPAGASFDPVTAMFSWTPGYTQAGTYAVNFTATDDGNGTGVLLSTAFTVPITITNTNRSPETGAIANNTLARGDVRELVLQATDPDGNPLQLTLSTLNGYALPGFVTFTDNGNGTALLRLAPGDGDRGDYTLTLTAADNGDGGGAGAIQAVSTSFVVSVNTVNERPVFSPIGDKVAVVGEPLSFTVQVRDLDQEPLSFNVQGLPAGATLTPLPTYGQAQFSWTPTAADLGNYNLNFQVVDSRTLSDVQAVRLVVRNTNAAPVLAPVGAVTIQENQALILPLVATDSDGDRLTYAATNLPAGAKLDALTGVLSWTPSLFQAGTYTGIQVTASDGNRSRTQTFSITVNNVNQAPVLAPLPLQSGRENVPLQFSLSATDIDRDSVIYRAVTPLPSGASLDSKTGAFHWTPGYEQAGDYTFRFAATDPQGSTSEIAVAVKIDNVNRTPTIGVSDHSAMLGQPLVFQVAGSDLDLNTTLTYSVKNLPDGATLNASTGEFRWTPGPGQAGSYTLSFEVSDGESSRTRTSVIQVGTRFAAPLVTIEQTPSFAVVPGQAVLLHTIADSQADISSIALTVNGQPVTLDSQGRASYIPTTSGRLVVEATATDADGLVGRASSILKVRDPLDGFAPVVSLDRALALSPLKTAKALQGSIADTNLDEWKLELGDFAGTHFQAIAQGNSPIGSGALTQLDPGALANGFYQVRLTATDLSGRTSTTQLAFEVNSSVKSAQYGKAQTDLSVDLGGTTLNLVRAYDSLNASDSGEFGYGWRLANTETNLQTNVPLTGQEQFGIYNPLQEGTRLYLTLPTGERVGFTFAPRVQSQPGAIYYTPAWVADPGVSYRLDSAQTLLSRGEDRFYDLKTAQAYNPASGAFEGAAYTLTAADGTVYRLDAQGTVRERANPNGSRFVFSDGGIVSSSGESIRFVRDDRGRLTQITASNGATVSYTYDDLGNLTMVRNLSQGVSQRYGYDAAHRLTLGSALGQTGESVVYGAGAPQVRSIQADLGGVYQFMSAGAVSGSLNAGETARYTFSLRDSEIQTTATDFVLIGVDVSGNGLLPSIQGLTPLVSRASGTDAYRLFAIEKGGLNLLELSGLGGSAGNYRIDLSVAGDLNRDGLVDGLDSQLLSLALGSRAGDAGYRTSYDLNRDFVIDGTDVQILGSNYGFIANRPPVITPSAILTHKDLETRISLADKVKDPEGDAIFYRLLNPVNGTVQVGADGKGVIFIPAPGFSGTAAFDLIADDGFSSSAKATFTLTVSNASLTNLEFVTGALRLETGESQVLQVEGDFADQENVLLPWSYLNLSSENSTVASVGLGQVTGLNNGLSILKADRNGLQAVTVVRVGQIPTPKNQQELYITIAEEQGLKLYPQAVTLIEGGKRQLLVSINDLPTSPDLRATSSGTRYFVSNSQVLQVSETGLITALDEGVATVTVINAGTLVTVPVQVQLPNFDSAVLGTKGGAVLAADGALVTIAPGAMVTDATVSIHQIAQSNLPLALPDAFQFAGAFQLDLGNQVLGIPAQIAIPAPVGLAAGTEVFFMSLDRMPDSNGGIKEVWVVEESGVVGADGFIRTQSPPWQGATRTGTYTMAVPKFRYKVLEAFLPTELLNIFNIGGNVVLDFAGAVVKAIASPILGYALLADQAIRFAQDKWNGTETIPIPVFEDPILDLFATRTAIEFSKDFVVVPVVGFPYPAVAGVSLNLAQLSPQGNPIARFTGFTPPPITARYDPTLESATVEFDDQGVLVRVKGVNFSSQNAQISLPGHIDNLFVRWQYGEQVFLQPVEKKNSTELIIRPPAIVPLGRGLQLQIVREIGTPENFSTAKSVAASLIIQTPIDRVWGAAPLSNSVKLINSENPSKVVAEDGSSNLLLASIAFGDNTEPRFVATLKDRVYVTLASDKSVALIDAIGLRELDTNPDTVGTMDRIKLNGAARPMSIVLSENNLYAYVGDQAAGSIYVIDIDPNSRTYNRHVKTIQIPGAIGIRRLTINNNGSLLLATIVGKDEGGIALIDINLAGDQTHELIQVIKTANGVEGITATDQPYTFLFTNRLSESEGFGRLTLKATGNSFASVFDYTKMQLGQLKDYFDVNNVTDVVWLKDSTTNIEYAFLSAANGRLLGTGIESIDGPKAGSNVGVIRIKPNEKPELVAATKPIPQGLSYSLSLSGDNRYLYVAMPGVASTFVYDTEEIIKTIVGNETELQNKPLEELNSKVGLATNVTPLPFFLQFLESTIKDRPVGTGSVWGTTSQHQGLEIITFEPQITGFGSARKIKFDWGLYDTTQNNQASAVQQQILAALSNYFIGSANAAEPPGFGDPVETKTPTNVPYSRESPGQIEKANNGGVVDGETRKMPGSTGSSGNSTSKGLPRSIRDLLKRPENVVSSILGTLGLLQLFIKNKQIIDGDPVGEPTAQPTTEIQEKLQNRIDVKQLKFYMSTQPIQNGLIPGDWNPNISKVNEDKDYNPNRIIEAIWVRDENSQDGMGTWSWIDTTGPQSKKGHSYEFELPADRILTAGQQYYWTVQIEKSQGQQEKSPWEKSTFFSLDYEKLDNKPQQAFPGVTIFYTGDELSGIPISSDIKNGLMGRSVRAMQTTRANASYSEAFVLSYSLKKHDWLIDGYRGDFASTFGMGEELDSIQKIRDYLSSRDKPLLIMLDPGTNLDERSQFSNSGFSEAEADEFFAALVKLDEALVRSPSVAIGSYDGQGNLTRTQGDLFNSPLHFIGLGRGATVNSEIIQRLGNLYPNAGGTSKENRDLQMTTIDPYKNSSSVANRSIYDPEIKIWNNVTYADNYYQSLGTKSGPAGTPIGADWEVDLSKYAGFDQITNQTIIDKQVSIDGSSRTIKDNGGVNVTSKLEELWGPHQRALAWYLGTMNVNTLAVPDPYGILNPGKSFTNKIFRRLGDLETIEINGSDVGNQTWYTPDYLLYNSGGNLSQVRHGNPNAVWEGIGTGWFHSVLGGGYDTRPYQYQNNLYSRTSLPANYFTANRTLVSADNTALPSLRGDYTVPTLFDGNFDAISPGWSTDGSKQLIAGWSSTSNGNAPLTQSSLRTWSQVAVESSAFGSYLDKMGTATFGGNYALKLEGGQSITHNNFVVPDWGALRFDLHTPRLLSGELTVLLTVDGLAPYPLGVINLEGGRNQDQVAYGVDGFETFTLNVPNEYRGKVANLRFGLTGGSTVYLDNIFFQSQHLLFGNPTDARQKIDPNTNYLLEKPQFAVSYNDRTKTANWVSWQLNKTWLPEQSGIDRLFTFSGDSTLPPEWYAVPNTALTGSGFERGHIAPNADRNRNSKDEKSTFITTNLLPQIPETNDSDSAWNALERYLRVTLVKADNRELQIISGGYGSQGAIQLANDNLSQPTQSAIKIPEYLWKVILVANPGQGVNDIRDNAEVIAVMIPNTVKPGSFPYTVTLPTGKIVNINSAGQWEDWQTWKVNGNDLELLLSRQFGSKFDFFSNIPSSIQESIERAGVSPTLSAPLLAETSASTDQSLFLFENQIRNNCFLKDGIIYFDVEPSSIAQIGSGEVNAYEMSLTSIGSSQISSAQVSIIKPTPSYVSFTQIGTNQISLPETSPIHVCPTEIGLSQIGTGQTSIIETSLTQVSASKVNSSKYGIIETNTHHINSAQVSSAQVSSAQINSTEVSLPSSITLQQFLTGHSFNLQNTTVPTWLEFLQGTSPFNLKIEIADLPTSQLAEANITGFDPAGRPDAGILYLDIDANGLGWYIDTTPWDNSEFSQNLTTSAYRATPDSLAYGHYDLLTTILHETAHLQGFIAGYSNFDNRVQTLNGSKVFVGDNFSAILTPDGSHLNSQVYPYDLMNTTLTPGVRKLPSALDIQILNAVRGEPGTASETQFAVRGSELAPTAALSAGALIGINNGSFDTTTDWYTRGDSHILNGQAILSEDSPYLSHLSQTFVIPQGAKALQFTLVNTNLHSSNSSLAPGDAFEVALLNHTTNTSVLPTLTGLSNTDALLNIQSNDLTPKKWTGKLSCHRVI
jgi:YD repeat-containing protein